MKCTEVLWSCLCFDRPTCYQLGAGCLPFELLCQFFGLLHDTSTRTRSSIISMYEGISPHCTRAAGHTLVDTSFPLSCLFVDSSGIKWPSWAVTVAQVSCACKCTGSVSNAFKIPARKVNKTCWGCMKIERKQVPCKPTKSTLFRGWYMSAWVVSVIRRFY